MFVCDSFLQIGLLQGRRGGAEGGAAVAHEAGTTSSKGLCVLPTQCSERCFESGADTADGANANARPIETYEFPSFEGVVSDFALFLFLLSTSSRGSRRLNLKGREAESAAAAWRTPNRRRKGFGTNAALDRNGDKDRRWTQ